MAESTEWKYPLAFDCFPLTNVEPDQIRTWKSTKTKGTNLRQTNRRPAFVQRHDDQSIGRRYDKAFERNDGRVGWDYRD